MMAKRMMAAGIAVVLAVAVGIATADPARAQTYPNKPVRILIGFAAGGPTDVVARLVAQKLSESLKQQFVVENRPGAGSNIAMGLAARAAPDGYTLLAVSSAFVVNPTLYGANITYDPYKDFVPITVAADSPNAVFVNPSVPAKTMKELIDAIHANPGKYSIATAGMGTTPDLAAELLRMTFKLDAVRVPFNGGAPSVQSVLQGQTPIGFGAIPPATELIKSGQLRGLAVAAKHRAPALPDVPTLAEAGIPDQESNTLAAILAPAGTPAPIIGLLHKEIVTALADPTIKARLIELGFDPVGNTPAQFTALIKAEIEKWGKVIRDANMKVE
ncbi:MAG TPA: tripartite tricarboxylate transporter substrate binding protein [Alphaproteobacteria bacterium]